MLNIILINLFNLLFISSTGSFINNDLTDFTFLNGDKTCKNVDITSTSGLIKSPQFDGKNYSCEWTIRLPTSYGLNFFFNKLELNNCKYEYLKIRNHKDEIVFDSCNVTKQVNYPYLVEIQSNQIKIEYERITTKLTKDPGFSLIFHTWRNSIGNFDCDESELKCIDTNRCIPLEFRCDCFNDCHNEDESRCNNKCNPLECDLETHFLCKNRQTSKLECVSNYLKCNQIIDCEDASDEINCHQTQQQCSFIYPLIDYGYISSPQYPQSYINNLNCSYFIIMQSHKTIQLRFKSLNLRKGIYRLQSNDSRKSLLIERERLLTSSNFNYDYDFISIYDGDSIYSPLLLHITAINNNLHNIPKAINSRSNKLLILFHSKPITSVFDSPNYGFNFTYQTKGFCIDNQLSCNFDSSYRPIQYEQNCYDHNQTCDDIWDCHNGADERFCGNCGETQFRCKNPNFCYNYEDRCDGEYQCTDKSDEMNCDSWFCNSNNGTFLCANKRCIYEQWVCDGANDCEDDSDELNCPTPFTRRIITTAVLGGTLCCLLLVMALGCACKLYSLRTIEYRTNLRLSGSSQQRRNRRDRRRTRRSLSLFNIIRRQNSNHENSNIVRSASTSSLSAPHSIAPPSYNQTMGLVDEYEQRQLAFIEHVRAIITNSSTNSNQTNSNIRSTSSSSSSRRRSHSTRRSEDPNSRHRRRHHRHNRDRTRVIIQPTQQTITNEIQHVSISQQNESNEQASNSLAQASSTSTQNLSKVTNGLKNRINKLLTNIVNHGDNIQYVQLTDTNLRSSQQQQLQQSQATQQSSSNTQHEQTANKDNDDISLLDP